MPLGSVMYELSRLLNYDSMPHQGLQHIADPACDWLCGTRVWANMCSERACAGPPAARAISTLCFFLLASLLAPLKHPI